MAPGWGRRAERIDETTAPIREWLIDALAPQPGDIVLELAAGPGSTGFAAAPLVGDDGRVISTDFSPAMVEVARRRAEALGVTNVEHRVMDAERLELEDDSVDGVLCRFGYMLMPDPEAAFDETRRVLRPGGRLALAVWRSPERNPWISLAGRVLVERGLLPAARAGRAGDVRRSRTRSACGASSRAPASRSSGSRTSPVHFTTTTSTTTSLRRARRAACSRGSGATRPRRSAQTIEARLDEAFEPFAVDGGLRAPRRRACVVAACGEPARARPRRRTASARPSAHDRVGLLAELLARRAEVPLEERVPEARRRSRCRATPRAPRPTRPGRSARRGSPLPAAAIATPCTSKLVSMTSPSGSAARRLSR